MNQIAFILEHTTLYWYSIVLALAVTAGICFYMAFCSHSGIRPSIAAASVFLAVSLSLVLSRIVFWYCRTNSFSSFQQALSSRSSGNLALAGAFFGCGLTAILLGRFTGNTGKLLDCMSIAGSCAICLGRLGSFFTSTDRGQILNDMTFLPWAYPILNATSGEPEYRLATFLFQSIIAGLLFLVLAILFFSPRAKKYLSDGKITVLFLMVYGASQVILDSTRYDSLYLRSNGFVSMVQILAAVALGVSIILSSIGAVRNLGFKKWMIPVWTAIVSLFGCAGYMEYYVQRHGRLALFSYVIMEHCLVAIVTLGIVFWKRSLLVNDPLEMQSQDSI